jgi:methionyl-tRNA formyltransferase
MLRAVFMGSPEFSLTSLRAVHRRCELVGVVSQPDRPAGRGRKLTAPPVKLAALELGVPVIQPIKVRDGQLVAALSQWAPELIVVTAYGRILPREVLELPKYGCINVHGSLLPRWRGAAPIQRAVLAGDRETGVAIMQMDEGCDTGAVFRMRSTPIGPRQTSGELFERLAELGGALLDEFLSEFPDVPPATPQSELPGEPTHAAKLDKHEGQVDWRASATQVIDHVRGMDPWPGAYSWRAGEVIKLFAAELGEGSGVAAPGQVIGVDEQGMHVACGQGTVRIGEVQVPGKRRMKARELAAGQPFFPGEQLGEPAA